MTVIMRMSIVFRHCSYTALSSFRFVFARSRWTVSLEEGCAKGTEAAASEEPDDRSDGDCTVVSATQVLKNKSSANLTLT
jgi:hypothetical protein